LTPAVPSASCPGWKQGPGTDEPAHPPAGITHGSPALAPGQLHLLPRTASQPLPPSRRPTAPAGEPHKSDNPERQRGGLEPDSETLYISSKRPGRAARATDSARTQGFTNQYSNEFLQYQKHQYDRKCSCGGKCIAPPAQGMTSFFSTIFEWVVIRNQTPGNPPQRHDSKYTEKYYGRRQIVRASYDYHPDNKGKQATNKSCSLRYKISIVSSVRLPWICPIKQSINCETCKPATC